MYLILVAYTDLGECKDPWDPVWDCGPHNSVSGECRDRSGWRDESELLGCEGKEGGVELINLYEGLWDGRVVVGSAGQEEWL